MKHALLRMLFILTWPLIFIYAPLKVRSRILVIKDGKYLGVKHYFGSNVWSLPGGGVHKGETYKDAAIRELHEELAIHVAPHDVMPLLDARTYNERGHFMRYVLFVVEVSKDMQVSKNHEISEVRWLPVDATGTANHVAQAVHQALSQGHLIK